MKPYCEHDGGSMTRTVTPKFSKPVGATFYPVDIDAVVASIVAPAASCEPWGAHRACLRGRGSLLAPKTRSGLRITMNIRAVLTQKTMSPPVTAPHA